MGAFRAWRPITDAEIEYFKIEANRSKKTDRIEASRVEDAFRKIAKKPKQFALMGDEYCCGLVAVWLAEKRPSLRDCDFGACFTHEFNVSLHYREGFMAGWDGIGKDEMLSGSSPAWPQGYDDGRAAWEACRHLAWPNLHRTSPEIEGVSE